MTFTVLLLYSSSTVPKWVHQAIKPLVRALERYIPQPYAAEIRGMASLYGSDISDVVMLNFAYEVSAYVWFIWVISIIKINLYLRCIVSFSFISFVIVWQQMDFNIIIIIPYTNINNKALYILNTFISHNSLFVYKYMNSCNYNYIIILVIFGSMMVVLVLFCVTGFVAALWLRTLQEIFIMAET